MWSQIIIKVECISLNDLVFFFLYFFSLIFYYLCHIKNAIWSESIFRLIICRFESNRFLLLSSCVSIWWDSFNTDYQSKQTYSLIRQMTRRFPPNRRCWVRLSCRIVGRQSLSVLMVNTTGKRCWRLTRRSYVIAFLSLPPRSIESNPFCYMDSKHEVWLLC